VQRCAPQNELGKTTPCIYASVPSILRHDQADHTSAKSWCLAVSFKWRCRRCSQGFKEQHSLHHLAVSSAQRDASHVQTLRPEFVAVGNLFTSSPNSTAIAPPLESTEQSCQNTHTHTLHCRSTAGAPRSHLSLCSLLLSLTSVVTKIEFVEIFFVFLGPIW